MLEAHLSFLETETLGKRIALNQQEDDDFQRQISTLLSRVDISKNRASMYDIISQMEIPKPNGH
ncbi:unnamed protein product [Brugia pahangi]|uniref:IDEAL domain-containing protein n=1 Tax=Brugia pahangi TaxID=6280 RepID=A0A0N4SYV1_BRUPA|nr:unnamed protein product [Brugia pahangi]